VVAEIDRMLPTQRIVAMDAGHFETFVVNTVSTPDPSHMLSTIDFGSVGMGLYQAIGAAVGRPDQHVVVFAGDGGFMMTLEELDTAVRKRIPLTLVIMNDNAFGVEAHMLRAQGLPLDVALYDNPDLAAVARALGAFALTVRRPDDLEAVAAAMRRKDGPVVVDAKVNPNVVHEVLVELTGKFGDGGRHAET
jgi:thiamine pyrophosphate-dependent acetolactate synthase large subunit-like protein